MLLGYFVATSEIEKDFMCKLAKCGLPCFKEKTASDRLRDQR